MERRRFIEVIAGGIVAAPLAAEAQQVKKVYRIGLLSAGSPAPATNLLQGLVDLGYVEGRDFVMEYRFAEGQADRLPGLAADLVRAPVDVIVTLTHRRPWRRCGRPELSQSFLRLPVIWWKRGS
jgi:putative ABC transport system substrate-binding protein